ncbi:hypothetical protein [Pelomonas caseinilytica]|uniref:hypothetical protein n=1 Tax=Pelomonas caseinilytica TaxID=2906763 RepID=UPI001F361EC6|nr:hypothetical protein [Pelomonas sp. P7]
MCRQLDAKSATGYAGAQFVVQVASQLVVERNLLEGAQDVFGQRGVHRWGSRMAARTGGPRGAGARAMGQYGRIGQCREIGAPDAFSIAPEFLIHGNIVAQSKKLRLNMYRHFADQGKP